MVPAPMIEATPAMLTALLAPAEAHFAKHTDRLLLTTILFGTNGMHRIRADELARQYEVPDEQVVSTIGELKDLGLVSEHAGRNLQGPSSEFYRTEIGKEYLHRLIRNTDAPQWSDLDITEARTVLEGAQSFSTFRYHQTLTLSQEQLAPIRDKIHRLLGTLARIEASAIRSAAGNTIVGGTIPALFLQVVDKSRIDEAPNLARPIQISDVPYPSVFDALNAGVTAIGGRAPDHWEASDFMRRRQTLYAQRNPSSTYTVRLSPLLNHPDTWRESTLQQLRSTQAREQAFLATMQPLVPEKRVVEQV